ARVRARVGIYRRDSDAAQVPTAVDHASHGRAPRRAYQRALCAQRERRGGILETVAESLWAGIYRGIRRRRRALDRAHRQRVALEQHTDVGAWRRGARLPHELRSEPGRVPHLAEPAVQTERGSARAAAVLAAADRSDAPFQRPGPGRRAGAVAHAEARFDP